MASPQRQFALADTNRHALWAPTVRRILTVLHNAYPVLLLVFFLTAFTVRSILDSNSNTNITKPTTTGPGGKPLPASLPRYPKSTVTPAMSLVHRLDCGGISQPVRFRTDHNRPLISKSSALTETGRSEGEPNEEAAESDCKDEDPNGEWEDEDDAFPKVEPKPVSSHSLLTRGLRRQGQSIPAVRRSRDRNGPFMSNSPQKDESQSQLSMTNAPNRSNPSPRTIRRKMLKDELPPSLRQNMLRERQGATMNAAEKRKTAQSSITATPTPCGYDVW